MFLSGVTRATAPQNAANTMTTRIQDSDTLVTPTGRETVEISPSPAVTSITLSATGTTNSPVNETTLGPTKRCPHQSLPGISSSAGTTAPYCGMLVSSWIERTNGAPRKT